MADRIRIEVGGGGNPRIGLGVPESPRVSVRGPYVGAHIPEFDGPYTATPSNHEQTFATVGKAMSQNFTVKPIPSNYGLITWNGSVLRVS